jgi:hypothetical protein
MRRRRSTSGATLVYLRDFADQTGELPDSFDGLIEDVFGPVLER